MKAKIISVSRRTDIPAFYTPWFINRIREGFCIYPNPRFPQKFYRVSLRKQDVIGFVFWTRHPAPLIQYLAEINSRGFAYYFQYTVIGYPRTIDPRSPTLDVAIKTFSELSGIVGPDRVIWRYDPIILSQHITVQWHRDNFRRIADSLAAVTRRVVVSVIDPYARTQNRMGAIEDGILYRPDDYREVLEMIVSEASCRNLSVQSCAEKHFDIEGIIPGGCVDASVLHSLNGSLVLEHIKLHNQRNDCLCHESVDIGINDSCGFGCLYCYATNSHEKARQMLARHRPEWTCISQNISDDGFINDNTQQLTLWEDY